MEQRDLVVLPGATLTISGILLMGPKAKIKVRQGARLIVEAAKIESSCLDQEWGGIIVNGNINKSHQAYMTDQMMPLLPDDPGVVHLGCAILKNASTAISAKRESAPYPVQVAQRGGLIVANLSYFINNRRAVEFLKYEETNLSKFTECIFESNRGKRAVTIWDCNNITFDRCRFRDLGNVDKNGEKSFDAGITVLDGGLIVKNDNSFEGLDIGIALESTAPGINNNLNIIGHIVGEQYEFVPGIPLDMINNTFEANTRHLQISSTDNLVIQNNNL